MVKNRLRQPQIVTLRRFLRGEEVRAFRKAHRLSANELAKHLIKDSSKGTTFSRAYVKRVESGGLRASPRFVKAFDELRATLTATPMSEPRTLHAIIHYQVPDEVQEVEILSPFVRCKGCRKYFVPIVPTQRMHNTAECRRNARKNARKKRK